MSKRATSGHPVDGFISRTEAEKVLYVLCVKYGFCLPPLWEARLKSNPPKSVAKFLDTVIHAEGMNPAAADSTMYNAMREEVRKAFERSKPVLDPTEPDKS